MRIENDIKLDFKDVLIRPKRSTLKSRSQVWRTRFLSLERRCIHQLCTRQVDLNRTYTFKHSGRTWTGVPIMAANMYARRIAWLHCTARSVRS